MTTEINTFRIKRGPAIDLPILAEGELGLTTDSHQLWVGTNAGNMIIAGASAGGDMLQSTYDTNHNGIVDMAEKLATARTINGVSFDGSANISITPANVGAEPALGNPANNGYVLSSTTGGTRSWIAASSGDMLKATYDVNADGVVDQAAKLQTARTINGVAFDGTANISLTSANIGSEPALGNPSTNGYVLSSTTSGARSWVVQSSGSGLPSQTGHSGQYLTTDGANPSWGTPAGGGDMLKATYDTNADGVVDQAAKLQTARTIAGVSFDGTANISLTPANVGAEPALGNPASNGYILSSTTGGARSWIAVAAPRASGIAFCFNGGSSAIPDNSQSCRYIVPCNKTATSINVVSTATPSAGVTCQVYQNGSSIGTVSLTTTSNTGSISVNLSTNDVLYAAIGAANGLVNLTIQLMVVDR